MRYEMISCDRTMVVPPQIAVCPVCQADLYLSFNRWNLEDDGTWTASSIGLRLDCSAEPDDRDPNISQDDWDAWDEAHGPRWSAQQDVRWHAVRQRVWQWVTTQYRFDIVGSEARRLMTGGRQR